MNQKSIKTLVQRAPSVLSNVPEPPSLVSPGLAEINAPPVPATLKPHFRTHLQQKKNDQSLNEISFAVGLTQQIGRKVIWRK